MNSQRIIDLASLIKKDNVVVDVGTDHGYLPIYLIKNKITNKVLASDISKNALDNARKNIAKYNYNSQIKLFVSDGLENVPKEYTTIVISGMGTDTIKHILKNVTEVPNIILQSNTKHEQLRNYMMNKGYKIEKELICYQNNKFYPIISYVIGKEKLEDYEIKFGKSYNIVYYKRLKQKYINILNNMPEQKNGKIKENIKQLNLLIKKSRQ